MMIVMNYSLTRLEYPRESSSDSILMSVLRGHTVYKFDFNYSRCRNKNILLLKTLSYTAGQNVEIVQGT